jgi:NADPH:quinone reductase-like Zn-dependent oxidoreductase
VKLSRELSAEVELQVIGISTDYRDSRKSAFQQYAVVSDFNATKVPKHLSALDAAPLGVAYVAAALALGICMGMDFVSEDRLTQGPDLLREIHALPKSALPEDIRKECFEGITIDERIKPGDWIVIWGGWIIDASITDHY